LICPVDLDDGGRSADISRRAASEMEAQKRIAELEAQLSASERAGAEAVRERPPRRRTKAPPATSAESLISAAERFRRRKARD
jgi:hypothetical protein